VSPKASTTQPDAKTSPSSAGKKSQPPVADAKDLPPLTKEPPPSTKNKGLKNGEEKGPEDNKEWNNGNPLDADKHIEQPVKVDDLKAAAGDHEKKELQ
jgi:hypothetical protein